MRIQWGLPGKGGPAETKAPFLTRTGEQRERHLPCDELQRFGGVEEASSLLEYMNLILFIPKLELGPWSPNGLY